MEWAAYCAPPLDINCYLRTAMAEGCLLLVVPWVAEYLTLMQEDLLSREEQYYRETWRLLASIYHNWLPFAALGRSIATVHCGLDDQSTDATCALSVPRSLLCIRVVIERVASIIPQVRVLDSLTTNTRKFWCTAAGLIHATPAPCW